MSLVPSPLVQSLIDLSVLAGREIMAIYATDFSAKEKGDLTPVTEADEAAERIILAGLARIDPSIPGDLRRSRLRGPHPGSVGTSSSSSIRSTAPRNSFPSNGEFTVNIALVENGVPVAGVVYAPALKRIFWGEKGVGAAQGKIEGDDCHRLAGARRARPAPPMAPPWSPAARTATRRPRTSSRRSR